MTWTADDAKRTSEALINTAKSIQAYKKKNYDKLTEKQRENMDDAFGALQNAATLAITEGVEQCLANLKDSVNTLTDVVAQTKAKIEVVTEIHQGIALIATLAGLGAAIVAKDPAKVLTAVTTLEKEVKEKSKEGPDSDKQI